MPINVDDISISHSSLLSLSLPLALVHPSPPPKSLSLTLSQPSQVQKHLHPTYRKGQLEVWPTKEEFQWRKGPLRSRRGSLHCLWGLWNWQVFVRQCIPWFEGQQCPGSLIFYFIYLLPTDWIIHHLSVSLRSMSPLRLIRNSVLHRRKAEWH